MLVYQLRLAWLSLRRNPILSVLIVSGIGLGIGVAMTFVTAFYVVSGDPIPHKSDRLFYVQLDSWDPQRPWDDDRPSEPPSQITYLDMVGIMRSDIPTYQGAMHKTYLTVHPPEEGVRPFRETVRMCFGDFFPMFDVPFRYGSGWRDEEDDGPGAVIVLGDAVNRKLFGGENSVGRTLRIEDREFRVVGVLERWRPTPKFYDTQNDEFGPVEEIFMPFRWGQEMQIGTSGNTSSWRSAGSGYEALLRSETVWIQMWVQLDTAEQKREYQAFLDAYVTEQKAAGRFQRPLNNRLRDVTEWLEAEEVMPDEARSLLTIALLFLLVCSVNLIGILLGKFLARAPEIGVRRALGASRRWVFVQHLIECEVIGVAGGLLGLVLAVGGLELLDRLYDSQLNFRLDMNMFWVALALALLSAMIAGVYPAWRICRIVPGYYLKLQ
ncbi:MAG TPA: ABC transporter permease [Candidatus Polarisedimenticolaceae bacterium]|nr:ABC transporter permease [Candidatus Polarisedimenticolaceae bacterium]